jgi:hypothetical protein
MEKWANEKKWDSLKKRNREWSGYVKKGDKDLSNEETG